MTFSAKQLVTFIANSHFEDNAPVCQKNGVSYATLPCSGVIYSNNFDLHFIGNSSFVHNKESSIELHGADCVVLAHSTLTFTNNTASAYGAAIALYECSYLTVSQDTQFIFEGNTAGTQGGAIYSGMCNGNDQASFETSECFVRFYNFSKHPNDWNSSFTFTNNRPNALYVTYMSPCWWPKERSLIVSKDDKEDTFCWPNWTYCNETGCNSSFCDTQIESGVSSMAFETMYVKMYSGQKMPFPTMYDGRSILISEGKVQLNYCVVSSENRKTTFFQNPLCSSPLCVNTNYHISKSLQLVGNSRSHIKVTTPDGLSSILVVDFLLCNWPYHSDDRYGIWVAKPCIIPEKYFSCNHDDCMTDDTIFIKDYQYCVTNHGGSLFIASCPLPYVNTQWSGQFSELGDNCSAGQCTCVDSAYNNRSGSELCSQCAKGFSVPINSIQLECLQCSVGKGWGWFLLLQVLPLTLMVAIVMLFNIELSSGPMHGFILYCQLISISYPGWFYPAWLSTLELIHIHTNNVR